MSNLDSVSLCAQTPLHVTGCPVHGEQDIIERICRVDGTLVYVQEL